MNDNLKLVEKNWLRYRTDVLDKILPPLISDEISKEILYDIAESIFYCAAELTLKDIAGAHACSKSHLEPVLESLARELQHYGAAMRVHEAHQ